MQDGARRQLLELIEDRSDIGDRFSSIYRIAPNGGGGFTSLVFRARDARTGHVIALKVLDPGVDRYRRAAFEREAELLERFAGPELVTMITPLAQFTEQLKTARGLPLDHSFQYFALEFARSTVEEAIVRRRWDAEATLEAFASMCSAVAALHRQGVVHRDLKPANFLLFRRDQVKLADLGSARLLSPAGEALLPHYSGPPGDIRYVGPEMVASLHDPNPDVAMAGDFYSLGAILFELTTGIPLMTFLFDLPYLVDLRQVFGAMQPDRRGDVFDALIPSIVDSHPLPSLRALPSILPRSVCGRVDDLYQALACLDHTERLVDFKRVRRQLEICQLILKNERQQRERIRERRQRRQARHLRKMVPRC